MSKLYFNRDATLFDGVGLFYRLNHPFSVVFRVQHGALKLAMKNGNYVRFIISKICTLGLLK